jgi:Mg-chelatase subunit ChlI
MADWSENVVIRELTEAVRKADKAFEREGGSARHYVRDHLLHTMDERALEIAPKGAMAWLKAARDLIADTNPHDDAGFYDDFVQDVLDRIDEVMRRG